MPVLAPVFGIFAVVAWLVLIGLHLLWHYTFGWVFTTLADLLDRVSIDLRFHTVHPFGSVSTWLRSLDRNVDHSLAAAAIALEHVPVWLFSRAAHLLDLIGSRIKAVALGVEHAVRKLVAVTIPRLVTRLLRAVWRELRSLSRYARRLIASLRREVSRLWRAARHALTWAVEHVSALRRWALGKVRGLWHEFAAVWKRLKHAERWLFGKGFLNLLHAAMRKLGAAWVFSYNWKWVGGWVTRFSLSDVVEFTKDAITIASETDMCKLAAYNYDVAVYVFEPVMAQLVGLGDWFCRHEGETMPSAVELHPGYGGDWAPSATPPIRGPFTPKRLAPSVPLPRGVIQA